MFCLFDGYRQESEQPGSGGSLQRVVQWRGTGVLAIGTEKTPFLFTTDPDYDPPKDYPLRSAVLAIRDDRGNRRNPLFVFDWHEIEAEAVDNIRWILKLQAKEQLPTIRIPSLSATALMMRGLISTIDRIT